MSGHFLDACLLPLIDGTPWTRLSYTVSYPLSSFLIHWALGIVFMLYVSMQIGRMRSLMRPGVLYFLRDPNDPEFRPFREMLERSFLEQFMRIGKSAVLYIACCCGLIGVFAKSVRWLFPTIHNVRLSFNDPVTEIPLDLFLHTLLRTVMDSIQPHATSSLLPSQSHMPVVSSASPPSFVEVVGIAGRNPSREDGNGSLDSIEHITLTDLLKWLNAPWSHWTLPKLPIIEGRAHQQDVASMAAAMVQSEQEATSRLRSTSCSVHHPPLKLLIPPTATEFVVVYKPECLLPECVSLQLSCG